MRFGLRRWHLIPAAAFAGVYVVPVLGVAVHGLSVLQSLGPPASAGGPRPGFLLVETTFATALVIAVPGLALSVYADARALERSSWAPDPRLYGGLALAYPLSLLVAGVYLRRRYHRVGLGSLSPGEPLTPDRLVASRWWYSIAAGATLFVAGLGAFLVPYGDALTFAGSLYVRAVIVVLFAGGGLALFAVGLAADIALVRGSAADWTPGRRRYTLPAMLVPAVVPVVAAVYLLNRRRHVGAP